MDDLLFWIYLSAIVSSLVGLFWWVLVVYTLFGIARRYERQLREAEAMGQRAVDTPPAQRSAINQQFLAVLERLTATGGQLKSVQRARYQNRVGELMGMASSAGIDWHPSL